MFKRTTFVPLMVLAVTAGSLATVAVRTSVLPHGSPVQTAQPADFVLTNGKIVTVEDGTPEAHAIAVRGDRIVALGSAADIKQHTGAATQVIDLNGQLVIPGFIEGHGHFNGVGEAQLNLNLMNTTSWDEIVAMVGAAVKNAKPGQWIYGRGWHQEKWTAPPSPNVEGFPTHASLDRVSPDNPVVLTHASGHARFVNAKALELSGITAATANPPGGDLLKDASGAPTGLLRERASELIRRGAGEPRRTAAERLARARKVLELAAQEVLSKGVTSFQDAGSSFADVDVMKAMVDDGKLGVRLWIMIRENNAALAQNLAKYRMVDYGNGHLTVRAIKHSIDGALGPRGAWLLEPYSDKPGDTGHNTTPIEVIAETAKLALQHDYQLCVHAIGDRANRETLNIFEKAFAANPARKDVRWRVEHAQHLHPSDIPRFGQLGVIASMQGIHCTSDAPYVPARLGARRAEDGAYVWQKLMKSGAIVTNGTDAPVEDVDPIASYYATVSRKLKDGSVFYPDQRMSRMEALRSYTIKAAHAAFEESSRGSLKVGKYADMVVLSKDITSIPEDQIPTTEVMYTIVGGKVRYKKLGIR
ncbi:MAG: amidohydrolase [Acidobacteria bacterium]|nr:amidohydrolase [Acidobacteriota bacterium]MCA1650721.1 amidohydrolase [Acidobacteriota bacterium]